MSDDARRRKALAILREGRLTVLAARMSPSALQPDSLCASVRSSRPGGDRYAVDLRGHIWTCTCDRAGCAHILAAQLVTGYATKVRAA